MSRMTVAHALAQAQQAGVPRLDAQLLLARRLERPRTWLLAHDDTSLDAPQAAAYAADLERRAGGEPLAYIVGEKEFHGLTLQIDARVLVPRADTETLVDWGLDLLRGAVFHDPAPRVIDLGTGSGAIALALKYEFPAARVSATDFSSPALAVAVANAQRLNLDIAFIQGDWWSAVGDQRFHLALANPPYIAENDAHLPALRHEPAHALTSGRDGEDALRQLIAQAPAHLEPGGWLLLEHGHEQSAPVRQLLACRGFVDVQTREDLAGIGRCTGGCFRPVQ